MAAWFPCGDVNFRLPVILDATSARTEITGQFIKNFTSPLADFNEVVQMAPGTFSVNSNGVGLTSRRKTYFRGFSDGQYTMTFDGIPFQDTNTTPTHHHGRSFRTMDWRHGFRP
mgnify:CR=1 FL=1